MRHTQPTGRHHLYQSALDADEAYTRTIQRIYGGSVTRWTVPPTEHSDVRAARLRKVQADEAWLVELRRSVRVTA